MKQRAGFALLLAVVVLLLVEAMAAGMLALGMQTRAIAASDSRSTRARLAAESAVRRTIAAAQPSRFDTLAIGSVVSGGSGGTGDVTWAATVERLQAGLLVRARALVGSPGAFSVGQSSAWVRMLDRQRVMAELNAALTAYDVSAISGAAELRGQLDLLPPEWTHSLCSLADSLEMPAALRAAVPPFLGDAVHFDGAVTVDSTLAMEDSFAIGGIRWRELPDIADRRESGTLLPAPAEEEGECNPAAPANWGDPERSGSCADYFPLIYSKTDLVMTGGVGQGLLLVDGTLTIRSGARFTGVVVAREGLVLEPGAVVWGAAAAQGTALVNGSVLSYSRCVLGRALALAIAAQRPVLGQRTFIPAF